MINSWKLTIACTRAEAEQFPADLVQLDYDPPPVLMTSEVDEAADRWQLDVYTEGQPPHDLVAAVLAHIPGAKGTYTLVELEDEDWLTLSQSGLNPIEAGRYFVHTAADRARVPAGCISLQIEAGLAFGTGQHATTTGCLLEIDALDTPPQNALDLGSGTAILALAITKRWPSARVTASDIDPVAVAVSHENIAINGVAHGDAPGEISLVVADGLADPMLQRSSPYDLIVANILAGPLIEMAPSIAAALGSGGTLILAGLLSGQADGVEAAYKTVGFMPRSRRPIGEWPTLILNKI